MTQQRPIFITARFRSGSTMLWNLYEHAAGYRAYYEPCHDNLIAHIRNTRPTNNHRGLRSYWQSYEAFQDELTAAHDPAFGLTRLYLEADDEWPELEDYLRLLIERCPPGEVPVLQFNRMDLRLPWLRARFPEARIVHLRRGARATWQSMVQHLDPAWRDHPNEAHVYDTFEWCCALAQDFPFLVDEQARSLFDRHYPLWRLSDVMGRRIADLSLSYEVDFLSGSGAGLRKLAEAGLHDAAQCDALASLIDAKPSSAKAPASTPSDLDALAARWDERLAALGLLEDLGSKTLAQIQSEHAQPWSREARDLAPVVQHLLGMISGQRNDIVDLIGTTP